MSRETPQAVFEHAQAAMLRGDLFDVFTCLDVNDLKRIAANAIALALGARIDDADGEVRRICDEHRFPLDALLSARRRIMQTPGREVTTNQRDTMKRGLAAVSNLPAFLAALEGYSRRVSAGGSISTRLFQNKTLTNVQIEGAHAWATRLHAPDSGTAECSASRVSSANEARTTCDVLYRMWPRCLQPEGRKRSLLQNEWKTTQHRH